MAHQTEFAAAQSYWGETHEEAVCHLRCFVAELSSPLTPPTAEDLLGVGVAPEMLRNITGAMARRGAQAGASLPELETCVLKHAGLLDQMYQLVRCARTAASDLAPEVAADRGPCGQRRSPADRCATLAAPLRAYEVELQFKQAALATLRERPSMAEVQTLLIAWEAQPSLEPLRAMTAGLEHQEQLEAAAIPLEGPG